MFVLTLIVSKKRFIIKAIKSYECSVHLIYYYQFRTSILKIFGGYIGLKKL